MFFYGFSVLLSMVACYSLSTDAALVRQKRLVGGYKYYQGEYPFHVSLWYMGDNNPYTANTPNLHHTCGGSLVGDRWVLTAGTCFDNNFLPGLGNFSLWKVYLGMHAQLDAEDEAQEHTIEQIFRPPQYNFSEFYGDVALLKLDEPASLNANVGIVQPNQDSDCPKVYKEANIIGWGQTQNHTYGLGSNVPYKATVYVTDVKYCRNQYQSAEIQKYFGMKPRIDEGSLCAGVHEGGIDGCYGDLGSPLLAKCGQDGGEVVVGISNYGFGCGKAGYPGVYTRVSAYYEWIKNTMGDNS